eukprot:CAMPEP_0198155050 /NCGR_PEP_ID=MMETSP1443-20131203/68930_1 /TAXON_ID=186043 /ORGANISM="Entomoneis sp., Strain CCMP2396" /LENGTH=77 /DNA_ID=CAMNT_0043821783 /DNA_START=45 /DNA_END=278 /DNA_ORIENTATION=-
MSDHHEAAASAAASAANGGGEDQQEEGLVSEHDIVNFAWLLVFVFTLVACAFLNCAIEEQREKYDRSKRKAKERQEN